MTRTNPEDLDPDYDPSAELAERIAEALDARGIHQRGDLGFDNVVSTLESDAFCDASELVPAYQDREHPDNDTAYLRVYETALDMPEEAMSELVAGYDRKWSLYTSIDADEYRFCEQCGDGNSDTLEIEAVDGKLSVSHRYGCYNNDTLEDATPEEVLEFLRGMLWDGIDDAKAKTVEGIIEGFEKVMDRPYLQP